MYIYIYMYWTDPHVFEPQCVLKQIICPNHLFDPKLTQTEEEKWMLMRSVAALSGNLGMAKKKSSLRSSESLIWLWLFRKKISMNPRNWSGLVSNNRSLGLLPCLKIVLDIVRLVVRLDGESDWHHQVTRCHASQTSRPWNAQILLNFRMEIILLYRVSNLSRWSPQNINYPHKIMISPWYPHDIPMISP